MIRYNVIDNERFLHDMKHANVLCARHVGELLSMLHNNYITVIMHKHLTSFSYLAEPYKITMLADKCW